MHCEKEEEEEPPPCRAGRGGQGLGAGMYEGTSQLTEKDCASRDWIGREPQTQDRERQ